MKIEKSTGIKKSLRPSVRFMLKVPQSSVNNNAQAMPLVQLNGGQDEPDRERLVNNYSVNSFWNSQNELTVTRSFERKYSTMQFKPATEKNRVDIVVTQGEYLDSQKDFLDLENFSSQDIRREYRGKAKCLVILVFSLLFLMLAVLLFCLFRASAKENPNYGITHDDVDIMNHGFILPVLDNSTVPYGNFTAEPNLNTTDSLIQNITSSELI